jgi:hypothetical protein
MSTALPASLSHPVDSCVSDSFSFSSSSLPHSALKMDHQNNVSASISDNHSSSTPIPTISASPPSPPLTSPVSSFPLDPSLQLPSGLNFSSSDIGFCRLVSRHFVLTLHSPEFLLGRRMLSALPKTIGISPNKNISRQHCHIWYNHSLGGWQLKCLGKNGMYVNQTFVMQNHVIPLENERATEAPHRLTIADESVFFILPSQLS